jgi:hypothetical protein
VLAEFRGEAIGFSGEPIENARLIWNFGDGSSSEGRAVLHAWRYPGEYVVVLSAASGEYSAMAQQVVRVAAAELAVSAVAPGASGFIAIANALGERVDLSRWQLRAGAESFTLPTNTVIAPRASLRFAAETTGLSAVDGEEVALFYPNGSVAARYEWPRAVESAAGTHDTAARTEVASRRETATLPAAAAAAAPVSPPQAAARASAARGSEPRSKQESAGARAQEGASESADEPAAGIGAVALPPPAAGCGDGAASGTLSLLSGGRLGIYIAALTGLAALGALAFLATRRNAPDLAAESLPPREADEYEIVD